MPTRPAPKPPAPPKPPAAKPTPKPPAPPAPPKPPVVATRPAPAATKPPVIATRPAPAARNQPSKPTTPKPTTPKPTTTKPTGSKPTTTKPTGAKPTGAKPTTTKPTGTKPTGAGGAPAANSAPNTGVPEGGTQESTDSGEVNVELTPEQRKQAESNIAAEAEKQQQASDEALAGRYTTAAGRMGITLYKPDGTPATFQDFAKAGADAKNFTIKDALGRDVSAASAGDILGTDVYGPGAKENIAGTDLGNLILESRKAGAAAAEGRASSGISAGSGVGAAQQQALGTAGNQDVVNLIRGLQGEAIDIQSERGRNLLDTIKELSSGDTSRFLPDGTKVSTPGATPKPTTPKTKTPKTPSTKPKAPKTPKGKTRVSKDAKGNSWNQTWNGTKWVTTTRVR